MGCEHGLPENGLFIYYIASSPSHWSSHWGARDTVCCAWLAMCFFVAFPFEPHSNPIQTPFKPHSNPTLSLALSQFSTGLEKIVEQHAGFVGWQWAGAVLALFPPTHPLAPETTTAAARGEAGALHACEAVSEIMSWFKATQKIGRFERGLEPFDVSFGVHTALMPGGLLGSEVRAFTPTAL